MKTKKSQTIFGLVVFTVFLTFVLIFKYKLSAPITSWPPLFFILLPLLFMLIFINNDIALMALILSMLLSPEFQIGGIPGRAVAVRFDDAILAAIFFGWLTKMAVHKELGALRISMLNKPIIVYIVACLVSSLWGGLSGTTNIKYSFFYILKYVEYFMVFFMVSNNVTSTKQVKRFTALILMTAVVVSIYALFSYFIKGMRATAPFEGEMGEANTLAGYLLLIIFICLGCIIHIESLWLRIGLAAVACFGLAAFIYTLSRTGWIAAACAYPALVITAKKNKHILLILAAATALLMPIITPGVARQRVQNTFARGSTYTIMGQKITLDESGSARIRSAQRSIEMWKRRPILGHGVPAGGAISDIQYTRILKEGGIVGLTIFIWILATLYRLGISTYRNTDIADVGRGITLGFLAALTGLIVMGIGAEIFIIIRVMEPFWFLAAMVSVLPAIAEREKKLKIPAAT